VGRFYVGLVWLRVIITVVIVWEVDLRNGDSDGDTFVLRNFDTRGFGWV
jgi:hypothetical protein